MQWPDFWLQQISASCWLRHLGLHSSREPPSWLTLLSTCLLLADPLLNQVLIGEQLRPHFLEPSLDWMTQKISGKLSSGRSKRVEMWTMNRPRFPWLPFGPPRRGPQCTQGVPMLDEHLARSPLFPGFVPPQRPCVGRWWWLCFRQHGVAMCVTSPPVIPPDGGLYHGYRPVTFGWCFFASEFDSDLP